MDSITCPLTEKKIEGEGFRLGFQLRLIKGRKGVLGFGVRVVPSLG